MDMNLHFYRVSYNK